MKVLHLASGDGWAGAEMSLALLARGCREQNDLELACLLLNEGRLAEALRQLGLPVEVLPEARHSFWGLVRAVRQRIGEGRFDVVHAHRYKEMLITALARPPRRCRFVVTVHGLQPWRQLGVARSLQVWASLWAARLAGASFVAVSRELQERLGRVLGGKRVVGISNPLDPSPPEEGRSPSDDLRGRFGWHTQRPLVGFVGRLEEVKGPDLFLEIAKQVTVDAGFVVIGDGSLAETLRSLATEAGLRDRVGFTGEVSDARPYLAQLDVLALPSRHEGLPMVLLEAASCELPVVAFDVGGVAEVLDGGPATRLVPAGDTHSFAQTLEAQLREPSQTRAAAVRWSTAVRRRFGLESATAAYLAVYRGDSRALRGGAEEEAERRVNRPRS
jgi:glycosyltransferase involved in cell wall biosynthesis